MIFKYPDLITVLLKDLIFLNILIIELLFSKELVSSARTRGGRNTIFRLCFYPYFCYCSFLFIMLGRNLLRKKNSLEPARTTSVSTTVSFPENLCECGVTQSRPVSQLGASGYLHFSTFSLLDLPFPLFAWIILCPGRSLPSRFTKRLHYTLIAFNTLILLIL